MKFKEYILFGIFGAFTFFILPLVPAMLNNTDHIPTKHIFWFSGLRALEVSPIAMCSVLIIGASAGVLGRKLYGGING